MDRIQELINIIWNTEDSEARIRAIAPQLSTEDARRLRVGVEAKQEHALKNLPRRLLNVNGDLCTIR